MTLAQRSHAGGQKSSVHASDGVPLMHAGRARQLEPHAGTTGLTAAQWGQVFEAAVGALQKYSQAQPGDRTMLDALVPAQTACCAALQQGKCCRLP